MLTTYSGQFFAVIAVASLPTQTPAGGECLQAWPYSSRRRHQKPLSLRPRGARSSHW